MKIAAIDEAPRCPQALVYLWNWFDEISIGLSSNGFGPAILTWEALKAWSEFAVIRLEPWEARVLVTLGYKRALIHGEEQQKTQGKPSA